MLDGKSIQMLLCLLLLCHGCGGQERERAITFSVGGAPQELAFWDRLVEQFQAETGVKVTLLRQPIATDQRQILRKVIYPVARPGLFSATLLAFVFAFNEFPFALMLTTDHRARTIPVGIALFEGVHGQIPWGEIMAAASLSTVPLAVLTLIFQRNIMQGLTMGAIKG